MRLYVPALCLTVLVLIIANLRRANRAARLHLTTPTSPLPSHTENPKPPPPPPTPPTTVPSPYSASSAYSYSYAYSNTPPTASQPRRERPVLPPAPLLPTQEEEEEEEEGTDGDGVRAHYLYMPPASPVPGDLLARRQFSARGASPDRVGVATGPPPRAWSFTYAFTFRGRRRRVAVQAPVWWPRRGGVGGAAARRRRRREEVWSAVGRDFGRVIGPAIVVWVGLLWLY
jgi:hypothetical protein